MAPGIYGHALFQVRAFPAGHARWRGVQRHQPLLGRGQAAHIDTKLLQRLIERVDLRTRRLYARLTDLREVPWRDESREQPDDDHHDEQLEQREAALFGGLRRLSHASAHVALARL